MLCVHVYMQKMVLRYWWEYGNEKKKQVEWKAPIDTMGIESADLKEKSLF